MVDPMNLMPRSRDPFPKTDLYRGYIGDGVPVCADLPEKMFLRKGAKYVYRGWTQVCATDSTKLTGSTGDGGCGDNTAGYPNGHFAGPYGAVHLSPDSPLRHILCAADVDGTCTFPSELSLDQNLACDMSVLLPPLQIKVRQTLKQCSAVRAGTMSILRSSTMATHQRIQRLGWPIVCKSTDSSCRPACCNSDASASSPAMGMCHIQRERVSFDEAQRRCAATPQTPIIDMPSRPSPTGGVYPAHWDEYEPLPTGNYFMAVDPAGNTDLSQCKLESTPLEVRCCSDTQVGNFIAGTIDTTQTTNLAVGQPCTESSGWRGCELAFDGNTDGAFAGGSVTHSDAPVDGAAEWYQVDLGGVRSIEAVNVYHRSDCRGGRITARRSSSAARRLFWWNWVAARL